MVDSPIPVEAPFAVPAGTLVQPHADPSDGALAVHVEGGGTGPAAPGGSLSVVDATSSGGLTFGGTATSSAALLIPAWPQNTAVVAGEVVQNGGNVYVCTTGGTTANAPGGPSGTGTNIADGGTVKWTGYAGTGFGGELVKDTDQSTDIYVGFSSTITAGGAESGDDIFARTGDTFPRGTDVTKLYVIGGAASVAFTVILTL